MSTLKHPDNAIGVYVVEKEIYEIVTIHWCINMHLVITFDSIDNEPFILW